MRKLHNVLIFTPDRDTPDHKTGAMQRDYSRVFRPEATRFAEVHGVPPGRTYPTNVALPPEERLSHVVGCVEAMPDLVDCVVFLCHGWAHGCQLGLTTGGCAAFVRATGPKLARDVLFVLYACSTGDGEGDQKHGPGGDGGLADALRDCLCAAGLTECTVIGHTLAGHATGNPYARIFLGAGGDRGGIGGEFVVSPDDAARWPLWRAWVDDDGPHKKELGRLRFPCMDAAEIDAAIGYVEPAQAIGTPAGPVVAPTDTPVSVATPA